MAWRDRLQPASFRGVPFFVDSADLEAGRRVVLHEYPLRDLPSAQDLGRAQRKFGVTAYVLGKDYLDARDRLLKALETGGAGTLILPTWPAQQMVLAAPARLSESKDEGGICRIALQFAEAGEPVHPAAAGAGPTAAAERVAAAQQAAAESFAARWSVWLPDTSNGLPGLVSSIVTEALGDEWGGLLQTLATVASDRSQWASAGADLLWQYLGDYLGDDVQILKDGQAMAEGLLGIVQGLVAPVSGTADADGVLTDLAAVATAPVWSAPDTGQRYPRSASQPGWYASWPMSSNREILRGNRSALADLLGQAVVIETARHLTDYVPVSTRDAVRRRDSLIGDLDGVVDDIQAWDARYRRATDADRGESDALTDALTACVIGAAATLTDAAGLIRVTQVTLTHTLPAVVLAYDRSEDERGAADIVVRNRVIHPLALPAGVPLEVQI